MSGRVHMGLEKPTSIVAMLRIFFRPITAKGGCALLLSVHAKLQPQSLVSLFCSGGGLKRGLTSSNRKNCTYVQILFF